MYSKFFSKYSPDDFKLLNGLSHFFQGIPLGLAAAVPLILTNRHVSYREQVMNMTFEEMLH